MTVNKPGLWGEIFAARYLRDNKYEIIAGNYRKRVGEIDIIAEKDGVVCFIEVKTRGENAIARPMEAVDFSKQEKIRAAAMAFERDNAQEVESRFDVIEIILDKNYKMKEINHIKAAF